MCVVPVFAYVTVLHNTRAGCHFPPKRSRNEIDLVRIIDDNSEADNILD